MKKITGQLYFLKGFLFFCLFVLTAGILVACGASSATENTLSFRSDGTITADFFADFPKERYNLTLFEEEAKASVKAYNETAGSRRIRLVSVSGNEEKAHITMRYRSFEDYQAFNRQNVYYGTVQDGLSSLSLEGSVKLRSSDGKETVTIRELGKAEQNGEARWRIIAVADTVLIRHKGTPSYLSSNAVIREDGLIAVNEDLPAGDLPETAYVVYKK